MTSGSSAARAASNATNVERAAADAVQPATTSWAPVRPRTATVALRTPLRTNHDATTNAQATPTQNHAKGYFSDFLFDLK